MRYDPKKIEAKWQKIWLAKKVYEPNLKGAKRSFYNLMMFPYPSAEGLHIGGVRTFTGVDIYGRFKRMQGHDVFEPMGLDGFGIHSENYALKIGKHPMRHAKDSEKNFYRQMREMGNGFAWDEHLETYDPKYYKWTQWIFVQMFKRGLAYRKKAAINWCPSCLTVLADEQVLSGECERCGTKVVKKDLEQWFFRTTKYAERLLNNLEKIDWDEKIKIAQKNWIGKSEGAEINFEIRPATKPNFVLLHSYGGSPETDFLPWLKKELEDRGYKVQVPRLPHADRARAEEAFDMQALRGIIFDADTVLLGHSLGAVVALRVVEQLAQPIQKLVLVGGFLEPKFRDHDRPFANTFSWKFDLKKIKDNAKSIRILHDPNDPIIPYDQGQKLKEALDGELSEVQPTKSHFSGEKEPSALAAALDSIKVFTTRPDTLFGATYMVLGPEHPLLQNQESRIKNQDEVNDYIKKAKTKTDDERIAEGNDPSTSSGLDKTGVELKGIKAINPANGEEIPVWVADYVLGNVGTGAIMAVPAHDERDFAFAKKYEIPIRHVVIPRFIDERNPQREGKRLVPRKLVIAIVRDPKSKKYLVLKWKKQPWTTFVTGGIDTGEDPIDAARREIKEETGYTHLKLIRILGGPTQAEFFATHKDENRISRTTSILFELEGDEREEISSEESDRYDMAWLSESEITRKEMVHAEIDLIRERLQTKEDVYTGNGVLINSGKFDGMDSEVAKWEITKFVEGKKTTNYRLRDWLISRQRYWGPPIPIIYCRKCWEIRNSKSEIRNPEYGVDYTEFNGGKFIIHPVPEKDLPVKLPYMKDFRPTGTDKSPLASFEKFYKVRCPSCKSWARRETDVSDTFLDSAWYYLRYPSVKFKKGPWDPAITKKWLPVDMYIGGAEHAVLHLLYVRFVALALQDMRVLKFSAKDGEPFEKFRTHGLIIKDGAKMSKSKGNVVNPDEYFNAYGADAMRMYLAFLAPLNQGGDFRDEGIRGITRFLERVWKFFENSKLKTQNSKSQLKNQNLKHAVHKAIKKITEDLENLHYNTAISAIMILLNEFEKHSSEVSLADWKIFLKLLAPLAPFISEELWSRFSKSGKSRIRDSRSESGQHSAFRSIHKEPWPRFDPKLIEEETFDLVIQVNGKVRGKVSLPMGAGESEARQAALELDQIKNQIGSPKKVIYVPNRLINFVV